MARMNPKAVADKWASRLGAAGDAIRAGVLNVTESPTAAAARASDRYAAGVAASVSNGNFQRGCQRVSVQDWQKSMTDKGIQRVATGAQQAKGKMEAHLAEFGPHLDALDSKLASMPRGDLEANINRMVTAARHNSEFKSRR